MFKAMHYIFLGLAYLLGGLAGLFLLYVMFTDTKEFFKNIINPLVALYFLPAIVCVWLAQWCEKKSK
jgi:uncharacterized membrane protein YqjE